MTYSHKDYKSNPMLATSEIGMNLKSGCLNLFIGAGASKGFGLPDWALLVARILGKESDPVYLAKLRTEGDGKLAKEANQADGDDLAVYLDKVHKALYQDIAPNLSDQLARSPLLLAVAALITGSCRGRVTNVFTYNYDDLLQQYLAMLGYAVCRRTDPYDFSIKCDVEINHVHGFLPQAWTTADKKSQLILSEKSYRNRRAGIDEGWSACVEHSLYSKNALFIGLSGDDSAITDILKRAQNSIAREAGSDYYGYWLLTPDAYARNSETIIDVGMCPIPIEKEQLPKFVFEVCQRACV